MRHSILLLVLALLIYACNSGYQPKPKGYFAIQVPTSRSYKLYSNPAFNCTFEYPTDCLLQQDSNYIDPNSNNQSWVNLVYPNYNCIVYLSYNKVGGTARYKVMNNLTGKYKDTLKVNSFDKLVKDAFDLTGKHIYKSNEITNTKVNNNNGLSGVLFTVGGDAASPLQFFVTDTAKHFFRGALYYDAQPKQDSTSPVTAFVKKDILHLINSMRWVK